MLSRATIAKARRAAKVLLEEPRVLAIGLPGEVESVAHERDAPKYEIDPDIREHPRQKER